MIVNLARFRVTSNSQRERGISLLELLVVLVILTILSVMVIPPLQQHFEDSEAKQVENSIKAILKEAKINSYTYRQHVVVCLADNNNNCHRDANQKMIAFFDTNDNHRFDADTDTIFKHYPLDLSYGRVYLGMGSRRHYIKFFGETGTPRGFMGHIKYCPNKIDSTNRYQISFSTMGTIRFKSDDLHPSGCP